MQRRLSFFGSVILAFSVAGVLAVGCGDDDSKSGGEAGSAGIGGGGSGGASGDGGGSSMPEAGTMDAGAQCGDSVVEAPEECDDGNDSEEDSCLNDCTLACGDGIVNAAETCDTAIAAGSEGACPTTCMTSDPCVMTALAGSGCSVHCEENTITATIANDGCCPAGANSLTDADCAASCGNGVVESGEACDTTITAGDGVCRTTATCDDSLPCTINGATNEGTCTAACDFSQPVLANMITVDGCCPADATYATDADCSANCGNGVVDASETCDTAIASGQVGACITSCTDDGDACTVESLNTANPCDPQCVVNTITAPAPNDQCCPAGANANTDSDCTPACGNGFLEPGEDCDETSATCNECRFVPVAYRITSLYIRDPHLYLAPPGCGDVTATANDNLINPMITQDTEGSDAGPDGFYDLSFVIIFRPLEQTLSPGNAELVVANCHVGPSPVVCDPDPMDVPQPFVYNNQSSGTCLEPNPGTTNPSYMPPIINSTAGANGCWSSVAKSITLGIGGLQLPFEGARFGGQWVDNPATGMIEGLIMGFMSQATAATITVPVLNAPLTGLLPDAPYNGCTDLNDDDLGPSGTRGWWFYLNAEAERVTWTGN